MLLIYYLALAISGPAEFGSFLCKFSGMNYQIMA